MKKWNNLVLILACLNFCSIHPARAENENSLQNIHQGNWNLGGSFNINQNSDVRSNSFQTNLAADVKYFLVDRFAFGLATRFGTESGNDMVLSTGPGATYFFYSHEQWASYVSAGIRFGLNDATVKSVFTSSIGLDYFITPSVAFGPSFYYDQVSGRYSSGYTQYGLLFNFGIFI